MNKVPRVSRGCTLPLSGLKPQTEAESRRPAQEQKMSASRAPRFKQELESILAINEARLQDEKILRDKLDAVESDNAARIIENASLHADLKVVKLALDEAKADAQAATERDTHMSMELRDKIESLSASLEEEKAIKSSLDADLDQLRAQNDDLQAQYSASEAARASVQNELQSQASASKQVELFRKQIIAMESDLIREKENVRVAEERRRR